MAITINTSRIRQLPDIVFDVSVNDNATPIVLADEYANFDALLIVAPPALTGTVSVAVLDDPDSNEALDASYRTAQSPPGTDITVAAGKATIITDFPAIGFRLESSGTEAADRVFRFYGQMRSSSGNL